MKVRDRLMNMVGKKDFKIAEDIGTGYILRLCIKYGSMLIRGKIVSLGHKNIASSIFVGRKVSIIEKKRVHIGTKTKIHDGSYIDALSNKDYGVNIGNNVVLGRNTRIECTGGLQSIGKGITIGDRSSFANDCFFGAAGGINVGEDVVAGQYIRFHSENHEYNDLDRLIKEQGVSHKGIVIGNNCWIGAGAVFLDGAKLGDGCVVGANAVVTKSFPENCIIAGIPAKIIGNRG